MPQFPEVDVALRPSWVFWGFFFSSWAFVGGFFCRSIFPPGGGAVLRSNNTPWIRGQAGVSVAEVVRVPSGQ